MLRTVPPLYKSSLIKAVASSFWLAESEKYEKDGYPGEFANPLTLAGDEEGKGANCNALSLVN